MKNTIYLVFPLLSSFALAACGTSGHTNNLFDNPDGGGAHGDMAAGFAPVDFAQPVATDDADTNNNEGKDAFIDPCLERAKLIYTIDQDNTLRSFTPDTLTFKAIGVLNCPVDFGDQPYSMGVDHNAN